MRLAFDGEVFIQIERTKELEFLYVTTIWSLGILILQKCLLKFKIYYLTNIFPYCMSCSPQRSYFRNAHQIKVYWSRKQIFKMLSQVQRNACVSSSNSAVTPSNTKQNPKSKKKESHFCIRKSG